MTRFNVAACAVLLALLAFIGTGEACATAPPSSSTDSVQVVVVSDHEWEMAMNTANTDTVVAEIKKQATESGVVFFTAGQITTRDGVHFEIVGALEKCLRIFEFFQRVVKKHAMTAPTIPKDKITSATVKCGTFDTITVL